MSVPIYSNIDVNLTGVDGNAHAILYEVSLAMKKHNVPHEDLDNFYLEAMSKDYNHLIQTCAAWVNIN